MDVRAYFARTFTTNCIHSDVRAKFACMRVMRVKITRVTLIVTIACTGKSSFWRNYELLVKKCQNDFGANNINYFIYLGKGNWIKKHLSKE